MAKLCRLIGWDETLAFIIQPNFLCQLFMVDKFHKGRVAGICSTNHHCQAGWGTKYIAPYRRFCWWSILCTLLNIGTLGNCPPLLSMSSGGFQICCNIMRSPFSLPFSTAHNRAQEIDQNRSKYRSSQWRAIHNSRYGPLDTLYWPFYKHWLLILQVKKLTWTAL